MHPEIAVLTDEYVEYRRVLVDTIAAENQRQGIGTLCICGRELNPRKENQQDFSLGNEIYTVLQDHNIKGIISLSGAIGHNVSVEHLGKFLNQFTLPKVSLGIAMPGLSSVVVNDHAGMTSLMRHLVKDTQARRFAFVRGFENDPYSQQRERIFRRVLREFDIPVDDRLIVSGNYDSFESYRAVSDLLIARGDSIDVIVAANDCMALSSARAAAARGYDVPNEILITGYDDTIEATKVSPALTTVRQPLSEMARMSVELLREQISIQDTRGGRTECSARTVSVTPELVIRGSTISSQSRDCSAAIISKKMLREQFSQSMSGLSAPDYSDFEEIADALYVDLIECSTTLLEVLDSDLVNRIQAGQQHWWSNLCHQVEKTVRRFVTQSGEDNIYMSIFAALTPIKERCWTITLEQEFQKQRLESANTNMQLRISSCTTLEDILAVTKDWLDIIKPRRFFLVRYETPGSAPKETAVLIHGYKVESALTNDDEVFCTNDLLPQSLKAELQSGLLVLNPVFAGELHFGYLLLDPTDLESSNMTSAALSIGNAMRNRYLISRLKIQADSLKGANAELVQLASFDALTGLPNRFHFRQQLESSFLQCTENNCRMSVLFIDLDGFKFVNDTLGHKAGDDLLVSVADELRAVVSEFTAASGFVARLGGDEFTIILHNDESTQLINTLAGKILVKVAEPRTLEGQAVAVSASIGYSSLSDGVKDAESLLHQADSAMYQSKRSGKNTVTLYEHRYDRSDDPGLQLESALRSALKEGSLVIHYQPRVDTGSGKFRAVEALTRWIEPTSTGPEVVAHPCEFIPVAEASGLIIDLDLHALEQSCLQVRRWQKQGIVLPVSVNISVIHLQQHGFVDGILEVINRHQVAPDSVELEITEGAAMTDIDTNIGKLQLLRNAGLRVAIDDFGTGYSSLAYLKRLPITSLKIDREFIKDYVNHVNNNEADAAIFKAIVTLGKTLALELIAEGVETESQLRFIRALGVDEAQGHLFCPPVPADEITDILMNASGTRNAA